MWPDTASTIDHTKQPPRTKKKQKKRGITRDKDKDRQEETRGRQETRTRVVFGYVFMSTKLRCVETKQFQDGESTLGLYINTDGKRIVSIYDLGVVA